MPLKITLWHYIDRLRHWYSICKNVTTKLIPSQSLSLDGRRSTADEVAAKPFHLSLFPAAVWESPNSIPIHFLMLSSRLFFCLPLLAPFTVPFKIAMSEDLEMWPCYLSFRFFTMVRRSSCTPVAFWILLRTSSFVTWSL